MKKTLALLCALLALQGAAFSYEGIFDKQQAVYLPSTKTWNNASMAPDRVVYTKKTSSGSGSLSEYYDSKGKLVIALSSNFEFIQDNKLYSAHNADLKFAEVAYNNGKLYEKAMTEEDVQKLFPNAKIVKVSDFKDGKLTIKKIPFVKKEVLVWNDTKNNYYKFAFKPESVKKDNNIAGLIEVKKLGKIVFSHYDDKEGTLTINVRMF